MACEGNTASILPDLIRAAKRKNSKRQPHLPKARALMNSGSGAADFVL